MLLRPVLLLLRHFGVGGLLVPLGRGVQPWRVVLRSLVPYALDELAARVGGAGVYAAESHLEGVPIHLELLHVALGPLDPQPRDQLLALGNAARDPSVRQLPVCSANDGRHVRGWRGLGVGLRRAHLGREPPLLSVFDNKGVEYQNETRWFNAILRSRRFTPHERTDCTRCRQRECW